MKEMGYGFYTERDWHLFSRNVDQWVERYYRIKMRITAGYWTGRAWTVRNGGIFINR